MDQRRLVLAVAEAAREHAVDPVRLEAVDAELERDVAGVLHHEAVDRLHHRGLVLAVDAGERLGDGLLDVGVGDELIADQAPVVAADLVPALVGRDVQGRGDLAPARHARLGDDARDVLRRPLVELPPVGLRDHRVLHARELVLVRVELPVLRHLDEVLVAELGLGVLDVVDRAPVVGEQVVLGAVLEAVDELERVARRERGEGEHARAGVVVHAAPRLVQVALGVAVRVLHRAVGLGDPRLEHADLLAPGRERDRVAAVLVDAALGEDLHPDLVQLAREPGRLHADVGRVGEHHRVLAGVALGLLLERGEVDEVLLAEALALALERADRLLQPRVLRAEHERAIERGDRAVALTGGEERLAVTARTPRARRERAGSRP